MKNDNSFFNKGYYESYLHAPALRQRIRRSFSPKTKVLFKTLRNLPVDAKVLDVGAGVGGLLQLMEWERNDLDTYGLDIGKPPTFLSKGEFLRGTVEYLPFEDETFDLVTCTHVLEHLHKPDIAVRELRRVCKKGGVVYIETPSQRSTLLPFGFSFWDYPTHIRPYTSVSLGRMLDAEGFSVLKSGTKTSIAGIVLGFPYFLASPFLRDPQASMIFPTYAFGLFVYSIGKKN